MTCSKFASGCYSVYVERIKKINKTTLTKHLISLFSQTRLSTTHRNYNFGYILELPPLLKKIIAQDDPVNLAGKGEIVIRWGYDDKRRSRQNVISICNIKFASLVLVVF